VSEPLVFVLPLPVNLGNSRMHWAQKDKARRDYWHALDIGVLTKRLPRPPGRPYPRAVLDAEIHHTHDTDRDNREARLKYAIDWLTSRGYIVDDSDAHLERTGFVRAVPCRRVTERKLVLTLTPLEVAA
jgi:hypothetical protein